MMTTRPAIEFPVIRVDGFGQSSSFIQSRPVQLSRTPSGSVTASQSKNGSGVPSHHITFTPGLAEHVGIIAHAVSWFQRSAPNGKITGIEGSASFKANVVAAAKSLGVQVVQPNGVQPVRPMAAATPPQQQPQPTVSA